MLKSVFDFYKSNKYTIWWTIGYVVATWAIMNYMFNFNIFSSVRWHQLMHAHLHGFAGMVFGILILAAVPMYIATTVVIARTKQPLFSIKIPESVKTFVKNAFTQTPMDEPAPETSAEPISDEVPPSPDTPPAENTERPIPENVPSEMRVAYMRAREHISRTPTSAFDLGNVTKASTTTKTPDAEQAEEIPIPTDFDIQDVDDVVDTVPTFTDINFDDDQDDDTPTEIDDIVQPTDTAAPVADYMKSQSVPYTIDSDVVVTDKFAIVAHTDPDFWVADMDTWFAAGKSRKSPIELVKHIASAHNVAPVLYLGTGNIMDIDQWRNTWESDGVHVITDLKDLI